LHDIHTKASWQWVACEIVTGEHIHEGRDCGAICLCVCKIWGFHSVDVEECGFLWNVTHCFFYLPANKNDDATLLGNNLRGFVKLPDTLHNIPED